MPAPARPDDNGGAGGGRASLSPDHRRHLATSAISDEVIARRGYQTVQIPLALEPLGFKQNQRRAPGILIPIHDIAGNIVLHQYRPDYPRARDGKPVKYETPSGARLVLDIPAGLRDRLSDPAQPLWITEGSKKVDALVSAGQVAIGVMGVDGWKGRAVTWEGIALDGRPVYLAFDSDVAVKPEVQRALKGLAALLASKGAKVHVVYLPSLGDAKTGVDDFLARGFSVQHLLDLATTFGVATAEVVTLADVEAEAVRWLWPGRIPLGKLTVLDGDPGLGKSTLTLDVAARVTTGRPMPDGGGTDLDGPADVLLLSLEDDLADTIRPRLDAAGADTRRVHALTLVTDDEGERTPEFPHDVEVLRGLVEQHGARLVIVDPLVAYLGAETDANKDQDVRRALARLAHLAQETGAALLCVRHLNKGSHGTSNPLYRGGGSIGIIGAARSGMAVAKDPEDEERRVLVMTKANLAAPVPALAFRVETVGEQLRIAWGGATTHTAASLLDSNAAASTGRGPRQEAVQFLTTLLAEGRLPVAEIKRAALDEGLSWGTVRKAKEVLGVRSLREGFGPGSTVYWDPPDRVTIVDRS